MAIKDAKSHNESPRIAIIMPAYNEGATIGATVSEIGKKIISKVPKARLMVFEDGSTDNTKEVLKKLQKRYPWFEAHSRPARMGYSNAVKNAFKTVSPNKFDYILFADADGQYDPDDFFKLWSIMKKESPDMIVAERMNRAEPFYRVVLSNGLHLIEHVLFSIGYNDVTSAFRLMKIRPARKLAEEVKFSRYNFWLEFTARAAEMKIKTKTIKVNYREREGASRVYSMKKIPKIVANEFGALIKTKAEGWSK